MIGGASPFRAGLPVAPFDGHGGCYSGSALRCASFDAFCFRFCWSAALPPPRDCCGLGALTWTPGRSIIPTTSIPTSRNDILYRVWKYGAAQRNTFSYPQPHHHELKAGLSTAQNSLHRGKFTNPTESSPSLDFPRSKPRVQTFLFPSSMSISRAGSSNYHGQLSGIPRFTPDGLTGQRPPSRPAVRILGTGTGLTRYDCHCQVADPGRFATGNVTISFALPQSDRSPSPTAAGSGTVPTRPTST